MSGACAAGGIDTLAGCGKTGDFSEIRNPHYAEFKMGRV
jgi:hypothetical protein